MAFFNSVGTASVGAADLVAGKLDFAEWFKVFGYAKMTTALLDRLTHHCHNVEPRDEIYQFLHTTAVA